MKLFAWPGAAAYGRTVPKSRIFEHAGANSALKELFVRDVEQITWAHKLAPETINLSATPTVAEIQVFRIALKSATLDQSVLRTIDRVIPFPLIFELTHDGRVRMAAAYKRPSEADSHRWVVGNHFESDWLPAGSPRKPLPLALDMAALYERLLSPLLGGQSGTAAAILNISEAPAAYTAPEVMSVQTRLTLEQRIALTEAIEAKTREIERIKARLGREKQFNKRVAINAELRDARQELERLTRQQAATAQH